MWINPETGQIYGGDCQAGDRAATEEEIAAWRASLVTLEVVKNECERRIDVAVGLNQKLNMLGSMVAKQIAGDHNDDALFIQSMQWIAAMKAACPGLVGNVAYQDDGNWPALSPDLLAFAARF